jgi:hypothetical protein
MSKPLETGTGTMGTTGAPMPKRDILSLKLPSHHPHATGKPIVSIFDRRQVRPFFGKFKSPTSRTVRRAIPDPYLSRTQFH